MLKGLKGLFGKKEEKEIIGSPVKGKVIPLSEVPDEAFAQGILGKGVAVEPEEGKLYAPCAGEIAMVFDTKHAISMMTEGGAELLLHVGLDTVNLKGEHFDTKVAAGDKVKMGDLLLTFDKEKIEAAGYPTVTPVVVCNSDDFSVMNTFEGKTVSPQETIMELAK